MKKTLRLLLMSMFVLFAGQAMAEDIIWQEDWSGFAESVKVDPNGLNPNYTFTGTTLNEDGSYKGGTAIYNEKIAGGDAPELLIAKGGGTFVAKVALNGKTGDLMLAYKCNKNLTITVEGATLGEKENTGNDYLYPVTVPGGTSEITITFTNGLSSNSRIDNIKLYQGSAKKPAGLSWGKASTTLYLDKEVTLVLSNENQLPVTYTSSDETVATIASDGTITLVAAGKTTLTAAFAGNDEYEAQTVSIDVTVKESSGDTPGPDPGTETDITVAKALEIISALEDNKTTSEEYSVKGYVVGDPDFQRKTDGSLYGNVNFTMGDNATATDLLTVYRAKYFGNVNFTEETISSLKAGDEVIVSGKLQKFVKDGVTTPEISSCHLTSINGQTGSDVTIEKVADIAAFNALASGTVAELTLNNAIVNYKNVNGNNTELFIRDSSGAALDLYNMGITAEAGQVLSGTIIGTRDSNSGFTFAMKASDKTDVSTVTVGAAQTVTPLEMGPDEVSNYVCDLVKIASATLSEDLKKCTADGADLPLYDRFKLNLLNGLDTSKTYDITGLVYDGGTTYGMELVITAITLAGGGEIITDPATPVASIEALIALGETSNVELTLTNAKVLLNDGNSIYVRENGKALCFYQINGLKDVAKTNYIINGKIILDYVVFNGMPEAKANKDTNLDALTFEESEEESEPVQTTLAAVAAGNNPADLVTLTATLVREVTYKDDGVTVNTTTYYLQDGETKVVVTNNGKNLKTLADEADETGVAKVITVTGIEYSTSKGGFQIKLTKDAVEGGEIAKKGDVNGDNAVDVADISAIISIMADGGTDLTGDVNGDKAVDVADISSVITIMAGGTVE